MNTCNNQQSNGKRKLLALTLALGSFGLQGQGQELLGQWNFEGGFDEGDEFLIKGVFDNGDELEIAADEFQEATTIDTAENLGVATDAFGSGASVLRVPKLEEAEGVFLSPDLLLNVDSGILDSWTILMDVYFPAETAGTRRGLVDIIGGDGFPGAEFYVGADDGITTAGVSGGVVQPETWTRLAWSVDSERDSPGIDMFIDGALAATFPLSDTLVLSQTASLTNDAMLFSDTSNAVELTYVSDIQIWDEPLGAGQIFALGGATAEGLPQELPTVPSFPESWMPKSNFSNATTEVGVVINSGGADVDTDSIVFKLDGVEANVSITTEDDLIIVSAGETTLPVSTDHVMELTYTDDKDGTRTFTREFRVPVLFEDFEGLELEDPIDEGGGESVWTKTAPEGWIIDDERDTDPGVSLPGVPGVGDPENDGVTEWAGWSFADKDWWVGVAGNQRRAEFILGEGTVMIADPDEWDDAAHLASSTRIDSGGPDHYDTFIALPPIDLSTVAEGSLFMTFDSSWRPEDQQTATLTVSYDGAEPIELLRWESVGSSPNFKPDNSTNEAVLVELNNPAGASEAIIEFGLIESGNDWWWAVDNIVIDAGCAPPTIITQPSRIDVPEGDSAELTVGSGGCDPLAFQWFKGRGAAREAIDGANDATLGWDAISKEDAGFYSVEISNEAGAITSANAQVNVLLAIPVRRLVEGFDDLELGPNVDESVEDATAFTMEGPEGWEIDNTNTPQGTVEWTGWSFADKNFWAAVAGQRRTEFTKGAGVIAVADGDEWDDNGDGSGAGDMNTFLTSAEIDLSGLIRESGVVQFDSSWRPFDEQKGSVIAEFNNGDTLELAIWESVDGPNFKAEAINETVSIGFTIPEGASSMTLTFGYENAGNDWWWVFDNLIVGGAVPPLFTEDFEDIPLRASTSRTEIRQPGAWSPILPNRGWSVDNSGTPAGGVDEFEGWTFADLDWWQRTAEDQRRTEFVNAAGTIMVADPDEWDDADPGPEAPGLMNSFASTPSIDVSGWKSNSVVLSFDSSWRPEDTQTAVINVSYDGGAPIEVLRWESNSSSANFKDNAPNERIKNLRLRYPEGASEMVVTFGMVDAGNDWWWAIDNISVDIFEGIALPEIITPPTGGGALEGNLFVLSVEALGADRFQWYIVDANGDRTAIDGATETTFEPLTSGIYEVDAINDGGATTSGRVSVEIEVPLVGNIIYFEGFEDIELGSNVDETVAGAEVWSATPPAGWMVDLLDTPAGGVTEWRGWGFANAVWWDAVAGQSRGAFTKAEGAVAIGDGDEWDDLAHDEGEMNTIMTTGAIDISGIDAGSAYLRFDSSWRPWDTQTGVINVSFDGGEPTEILRWESQNGNPDFFKSDDRAHWNESVIIPLNNPAGASELTLSFGYLTAGNDWWWAIDNITVGHHPFFEGFDNLAFGSNIDETTAGDAVWTDVGPDNWSVDASGVPGFGTDNDGVTEWAGWAFATFDWWSVAAGNQRRFEFLKASGGVAVADGDEWDDLPHAASGNLPENGGSESYDTFLTTPAISLGNFGENEAILEFDSSWRPEDSQTATVEASFDGGEPVEILRWESNNANGFFHGHEVNETVRIPLNNAADASEVVFTFGYTNAGNDWWWAIDNVKVSNFEREIVDIPGASSGISVDANTLSISFTGTVLESAPTVNGPWSTVEGATNPYVLTTDAVANGAIFFRSR